MLKRKHDLIIFVGGAILFLSYFMPWFYSPDSGTSYGYPLASILAFLKLVTMSGKSIVVILYQAVASWSYLLPTMVLISGSCCMYSSVSARHRYIVWCYVTGLLVFAINVYTITFLIEGQIAPSFGMYGCLVGTLIVAISSFKYRNLINIDLNEGDSACQIKASNLWHMGYDLQYKQGKSHIGDAEVIYHQIISEFPNSLEAGYARQQLAVIDEAKGQRIETEQSSLSSDTVVAEYCHSRPNSPSTRDVYEGGVKFEWVVVVILAMVIIGMGLYMKNMNARITQNENEASKQVSRTNSAIKMLRDREEYRRSYGGAEPTGMK